YPSSAGLMGQIRDRITQFIGTHLNLEHHHALELQERYYRTYKTSMRGLMIQHGVEPEAFMSFVHNIDLSDIYPDLCLREALQCLPGRRIIYTNASDRHAENILDRLGLTGVFDAVFDIKAADYLPKPFVSSYERLVQNLNIEPEKSVFVEDMPVNLEPAAHMGMTTVWLCAEDGGSKEGLPPEFVHYKIEDLTSWLRGQILAVC
ncbi:MAG: pyrimidine 5'-nucleotidase, partial [Kiloniellales bacterium]|nr:pyrimidine 5'-nucleotidase [Kiloniellales bacterium]